MVGISDLVQISHDLLLNISNFPNDTVILGTNADNNGFSGYLRFEPASIEDDINSLSFWGAIVFEGDQSGFATEFIGDMNDSASYTGQAFGSFPSGVR